MMPEFLPKMLIRAAVIAVSSLALLSNCNEPFGPVEPPAPPPPPLAYTISYNLNGGSGTRPVSQRVSSESCVTIASDSGFTRNRYNFVDWNTNSSGTGSNYNADSAFCPSSSITLYAVWTPVTYTVTYDANGGSGTTPASQTVINENSVTLASGSELTKNGYAFAGWSTDSSTHNSAGGSFTPTANITMYAIWYEYGTFADERDQTSYKWVTIGTQTWMAANLNYDTSGSVCYNNAPDNCATYGRLYDWATVMGLPSSCNSSTCASQVQSKHQGICPNGWHIPSDAEWTTLETFVGGSSTAGTKLKSKGGWYNNGNGTDDYDFSALPGGYGYGYNYGGGFDVAGGIGYWWSATELGASDAWGWYMYYDFGNVYRSYNYKTHLFSLRCLRDCASCD